jgi:hypothetical protein
MGYRKTFMESNPIIRRMSKEVPIQIHHIQMRSKNGSDKLSNLIAVAYSDHKVIHKDYTKDIQRKLKKSAGKTYYGI